MINERCENMKHSSKIIVFVSVFNFNDFIGGCGFINKEDSKETEIKQNFNKMLNVYPTKNLEDFTIKRAIVMKSLIKEIKEHG